MDAPMPCQIYYLIRMCSIAVVAADSPTAFVVTLKFGQTAMALASERDGWQHVAVSRTDRPMSYGELCQVKALFWGPQDAVLQFYPPDSERAPDQKFWLHLWRPIGCNLPLPAVELFAVPA